MTAAGIPVVVSAGNQASDACAQSPASAPTAITVGSMRIDDARSIFSSASCDRSWVVECFVRSLGRVLPENSKRARRLGRGRSIGRLHLTRHLCLIPPHEKTSDRASRFLPPGRP